RVAVFLIVRSIAVAVLEIDAEVFDRLTLQFRNDASINGIREIVRNAQDAAELEWIGREFVERAQSQRAELHRRVALEQVRAAVNGVHRLSRGGVSGKAAGKRDESLV